MLNGGCLCEMLVVYVKCWLFVLNVGCFCKLLVVYDNCWVFVKCCLC